ncbi:hypothetical protein [[Eubacterium] cellulosolvens]
MNYLIYCRYGKYKKIPDTNLNQSEDALTNVITVVLVIAIIMALIVGPYLTIIVPEQSRRNEADHANEIKESFGELRGTINNQLIDKSSVQTTRIKLGTDDENLFVQGGDGVLYFDSTEPLISVSSFYDAESIYGRGSGNIRYRSRNLYYTDINTIYENNAVFVSQLDKSAMTVNPDFEFERRDVIRTLNLDTSFAQLSSGDTVLRMIYLSNTMSSTVEINSARISWMGGNASTLTRLAIGPNPLEWNGSSASGIKFNFLSNYQLSKGSVRMTLVFDDDIRDAAVTIELFTSDSQTITRCWPEVSRDTVANVYDLNYPDSLTINDIKFKNLARHTVTIGYMALSWTGSAGLKRVEIPSYGNVVWDIGATGIDSPAYFKFQNESIIPAGDTAAIDLFFDSTIKDETINIKFFAENSSNNAQTSYPLDFNVTYLNASLSLVTLVCDDINIGGKSSVIIKSTLISSENNRYLWDDGESIRFNITTSYPEAWVDYLNNTLARNAELVWDIDGIGAYVGDYYITTEQKTEELTNVNLILSSIYQMDCIIGIVQVELG